MSDTSEQLPIIKGGQGRSDEEAEMQVWTALALLCLSVVVITMAVIRALYG